MNMTVIYIVFCVIFGIVILAALALGTSNAVVLSKRKNAAKQAQPQRQAIVYEGEDLTVRIREGRPELLPAGASAPGETPVPAAEAQEGVYLTRGEKLTFPEKLSRLAPEMQALLEAFCSYVEKLPECSRLQQAGAIALRYKKAQIAKVAIRKDAVILNFSIVNPDLGRMVREEKGTGLKLKPVEIRLTDEEALSVAKQTAELTVGYLKEEEEYKLEKRKEARREAAKKKRAASASAR